MNKHDLKKIIEGIPSCSRVLGMDMVSPGEVLVYVLVDDTDAAGRVFCECKENKNEWLPCGMKLGLEFFVVAFGRNEIYDV